MVDLKISFSKYDYFGILIPGFLLLTIIVFLLPFELFFNLSSLLKLLGNLEFAFIFLIGLGIIVIIYLIGVIVSGMGYWLIEGKIISKKLKYPSNHLLQKNERNKSNKFFKKYRSSYSELFRNQFNKTFNDYFKEKNYDENDKFKLCYHVVKEKSPIAFQRLTTFISLYGLYRNLTITFMIGTFLFLYQIIITHNLIYLVLIFAFPLLSLFCFNNFLKFFRIFADEVFRSFFIYTLEKQNCRKNDL